MPHAHLLPRKTCSHSPVYFPASKSLRRAAGLGLGLLSLLSLSAGHAALAGTVNWDGTANDWFASPSHWSNGSTPGAGDDAVNMSTAAMTLGQSTTINSFFSNGAFTLQGGTFSGNQAGSASTLTVNNVFTVNGGGISNFTVNQGQGGSLVFGNNGNNFLDNAVVNSGVSFTADAYTRLYDTDTFNGAVTLNSTSNGIQLQDSNTNLIIGRTGSLNGYGTIYQVYDGTVTNNGTVNANTAAQTLAINTDHFNNAGTAEATAAGSVLTLNTSGSNTGTFTASGGGMIGIHSGITSGASSEYNAASGTILVDGGNLTGTVGSTTGTGLTFSNNGNNYLNNATINGTLTFSALDAYTRIYNTVTENGAINMGTTSNGIQLQDSNTNLIIGSGGSLNGYGNLYQVYDGTITNNGTVNANSSGNALTQNVDHFANSAGATLEATNGGVLDLNTNTVNSGTIAAKTGGIVNISDSLVSNTGSLMDGAGGTFNVNAANLVGTLTGTTGTTLNFNNSGNNAINNGGSGTVLNTDLTFNNDAYTRIYGTTTSNNTIHFNSTANGIQLQDSNTNLINNGNLLGYGTIYQVYDGTVTNNGTINANSSGNTLAFSIDHTDNSAGATLDATGGGILNLTNNTTNSGTIAARTGGIVNIANNFVSNTGSLLDGASGTFNLQNAQVTGTLTGKAGTVLNFGNNGNNSISGATLNTDIALNADAYTRIYGTTTSNNTIHFNSTANGIQLQDSNTNLINNGNLLGYGTIYQVYDGTVTNNGTINANSSGNTLAFSIDHTDNSAGATLDATGGGILNLTNNTTNSGTIAARTGGVVNISGNFSSTAGSLLDGASGTFNLQNAQVTGTLTGKAGTVLNFGNNGNNSISGATLNTDIALNADAYTRIYGTTTSNNTINLSSTGNGIQLQDSNTNLIIGSTGSLNGYGTLYQVYDGTVTNSGTVNANVSGQTLNINTSAFNNAGTTAVQQGAALNVTSTNTDSGNILVAKGGTATFTQGVTQTAGLTQVNGTLNSPLSLSGGTLSGSGTVNGDVANSGGTVAAGSPFGTLAVNGAFSQASGTLDAVFSSTQSNLLLVSGAVTTGGTLSVSYLGSGAYTGFTPFTFLDYGSLGTEPTNALGLTQYFSNETPLTNTTGLITGQNGFTYELFNNTGLDAFQLQVLTNGAPVPEASTNLSLGALLALGGLGVWRAKRRPVNASPGHAAE